MKLAPALLALLSVADAKKKGKPVPEVSTTFASEWLTKLVGSSKPWLTVPAMVAALLALFAGAYLVYGGAKRPAPPAPQTVDVDKSTAAAVDEPEEEMFPYLNSLVGISTANVAGGSQ